MSSLATAAPRRAPAQVPVASTLPRFPSKPLVMAALALAVAACAHSGPPSQSLSGRICPTQTRGSRPSPAYLGSALFRPGCGASPVPLHPGTCSERREDRRDRVCLSSYLSIRGACPRTTAARKIRAVVRLIVKHAHARLNQTA